MDRTITLTVDGIEHRLDPGSASLLEVLRDRLGVRSPKDGCSPQGQCGCCTVLVDGAPRVACVTPASRVDGRSVTTVDGLPGGAGAAWAAALCATGGSQCGFCTPGIVVRLAAARAGAPGADPRDQLKAHLCRCTGWQTVVEAWELVGRPEAVAAQLATRDLDAAALRARLEGGVPQRVAPDVALGHGGFADDTAPPDALVAVRAGDGSWVVAETLCEARAAAGKVPGRRTTAPLRWPLEVPPGDWSRTLRTTWLEPAYLEPDASWCVPGGEPVTPLANGGAFGGKVASEVGAVARRLADGHRRAVRVLLSREDVVRLGPKRPPVAAGVRAGGTGVMRVVRTPGLEAPGFAVEHVDVPGPPTSAALRGAGWVEAAVLASSVRSATGPDLVEAPGGGVAEAFLDGDDTVRVRVSCGEVLDAVVLRSYCIGAAHQALGWVRTEGIAVDELGEPHDLTIRSFGVLRAADTPRIEVEIDGAARGPAVNGSDAVFAAVAAAAWRAEGFPPQWPCRR